LRILFVARELSYEPQGLMSMSAVLKQAGHEVALTVADQEDAVAYAADYRPDVLGFSVLTGTQQGYFDLNRRIRAVLDPVRAAAGLRPAFSAFGGPHPTFFPEMLGEDRVDGVCIGEGEGAILDLAEALAVAGNGHENRIGASVSTAVAADLPAPPQRNGFRLEIPNWWFKVEGQIVKNATRPLIHDLGGLPQPDRALIYDKHPALSKSGIKHFMSSRGCPYDCTYCFNRAYYEIYRGERRGHQRPVDNVIAEVREVRSRWPLEQVIFVDDLFILRNDWLEELADKWPQQVGLPFFCNVRADMLVKDPRKVDPIAAGPGR
jgi:anaerobic magnesium-protoporphyrin IX monomethyl ester cyclase